MKFHRLKSERWVFLRSVSWIHRRNTPTQRSQEVLALSVKKQHHYLTVSSFTASRRANSEPVTFRRPRTTTNTHTYENTQPDLTAGWCLKLSLWLFAFVFILFFSSLLWTVFQQPTHSSGLVSFFSFDLTRDILISSFFVLPGCFSSSLLHIQLIRLCR